MSNIITQTLEDAIYSWRETVKIAHPMFELPVETARENPKSQLLWLFATDNRRVRAHLYKPKEIDKIFENVVTKLYQTAYGRNGHKGLLPAIFGGKSKEHGFKKVLSFHNGVSLLIHELLHSLYMPNSSWSVDKEGKKVPGDKELIYQAILDGIKKALPGTPEADLITKTKNVENAIWDFGIDTFQYYFVSQNKGLARTLAKELEKSGYEIDSKAVDYFPEGVIPIFDVVSYAKDDKIPKSVLSLNRYIYSLMFCQDKETRKKLLKYFGKKIEAGGIYNIEELVKNSLKGLVKEVDLDLLIEKKIKPKEFEQEVDRIYRERETDEYDNQCLIENITSLLMDKKTRYDAIKGFIQPLAHLIDVSRYEHRGGNGSGQGSQGDISAVLDAILAGMSEEEANQFLQAIAAGNGSGGNPHTQQLMMQGRDEYYKRNSPEIEIKSPDTKAISLDMGKLKTWKRVKSDTVPVNELYKYNVTALVEFGKANNLPVLMKIARNLYQINFFKQEEVNLESYCFQQTGIDVARNWVLINDSSGTMGGGEPGCGTRWDGLLHINYGLLKTLYKASQQVEKDVDIWVVNFSSDTNLTEPINLKQFYEAKTSREKEVLLRPQSGGTTLNTSIFPKIQKQLQPGRTVWSFVTDGGITNDSQVYQQINQLLQQPDTSVLYFEMFTNSTLGNQLQSLMSSRNNLQYKSVSDMDQILNSTLEVLIKYEK